MQVTHRNNHSHHIQQNDPDVNTDVNADLNSEVNTDAGQKTEHSHGEHPHPPHPEEAAVNTAKRVAGTIKSVQGQAAQVAEIHREGSGKNVAATAGAYISGALAYVALDMIGNWLNPEGKHNDIAAGALAGAGTKHTTDRIISKMDIHGAPSLTNAIKSPAILGGIGGAAGIIGFNVAHKAINATLDAGANIAIQAVESQNDALELPSGNYLVPDMNDGFQYSRNPVEKKLDRGIEVSDVISPEKKNLISTTGAAFAGVVTADTAMHTVEHYKPGTGFLMHAVNTVRHTIKSPPVLGAATAVASLSYGLTKYGPEIREAVQEKVHDFTEKHSLSEDALNVLNTSA